MERLTHTNHERAQLDAALQEWLESFTFGRFKADHIPDNFEIMHGVPQGDIELHNCGQKGLRDSNRAE
jgi:hypothetical protein